MPAYNPSVDRKMFFCGGTCDPDFEMGPLPRGIILLGVRSAELKGKTPSRCPRLRNIALDKAVRGLYALDAMGLSAGM